MNTRTSVIATSLMFLTLGGFAFFTSSEATPNHTASCSKATIAPFVASNEQIALLAPVDFYYKVESRFMTRLTKAQLQTATSLEELLPGHCSGIVNYSRVDVIVLEDFYETSLIAEGDTSAFNDAQIELLRSMDYSTNFKFVVNYEAFNSVGNTRIKEYMTPHITVVPEQEAAYNGGMDSLENYLRNESALSLYGIQKDRVQSGKIFFTIGTSGNVEKVVNMSSCGYPAIDDRMFELIRTIPGQWKPATDDSGNRVEQELVFTYGIGGC